MKQLENSCELEITKILAKIMQSSYRKKQINELILRILQKVQNAMKPNYNDKDVEAIKLEFIALREEASSLMKL